MQRSLAVVVLQKNRIVSFAKRKSAKSRHSTKTKSYDETRIKSGIEEESEHEVVSVFGRNVQRRLSVLVAEIDLGSVIQQHLSSRNAIVPGGHV